MHARVVQTTRELPLSIQQIELRTPLQHKRHAWQRLAATPHSAAWLLPANQFNISR